MARITTSFIIMLLFYSGVFATTLTDLKKEAKHFKQQYYKQNSNQNNQSLKTLLDASQILINKNECYTAHQLLKTTFKLGGVADTFEHWIQFSQAAFCAKRYNDASKAAWLALQQAKSLIQKDSAYAMLGSALSQRNDWRHDWKPLALIYWEKVLARKKVPIIQKKYQQLAAKLAFSQQLKKQLVVELHFAKKDRQSPALCFSFNKSLPDTNQIFYQDYVKITPTFKPTYKVDGSELCVYGAAFGQSYQATIRQGLGNKKYKTVKDFEFSLKTTHRDAALWFKNSRYLLAKNATNGVPLYSINSKAVKLTLYRIDERNILNRFVQNNFQQNINKYTLDEIENDQGEIVWQTELDMPQKLDQQQSSLIPLPTKITQTAGLYLMVAEQAKDKSTSSWNDKATQWLVISDIGLTSYQGENGLTVIARSLQTNQPLQNIPLILYARNNHSLTTIKTDQRGIAFFDKAFLSGKKGNKAVQISALSKQGLSFLNLTKAAIDLSDRGIRGRLTTGAMDAFLYTERGVYRPAETAHIIGLLRDHLGLAISDLPLTMRLYNPAGKIVSEKVIKAQNNGAYAMTIPLSQQARTGRWRVALFIDAINNQLLGDTHFLVEAIRPPKISVTLTAESEIIANKTNTAHLNAQYLFGSPVIERPVNATLTLEKDTAPFAEYAAFYFDIASKKINSQRLELAESQTNNKGKADILLALPSQNEIKQPLKARLSASVIDLDGQTVSTNISFKVRHLAQYLGIKPNFKNKRSPAHETLTFDLLHLNHKGEPSKKDQLTWTLFEEEINYQWFYKNNRWQYERSILQIEQQKGQINMDEDGLTQIKTAVETGHYRLVLTDPKSQQSASFKFQAGDQLDSQDDTPDALELSIDKAAYKVGDNAIIDIQSPFEGAATLVIASDRIHYIEHFKLSKNSQIQVPIKQNWGAGAYALITGYQQQTSDKTLIKRAIGVIWLKQDQSQKTLKIAMQLPDEVRPRQTIKIPVFIQQQQSEDIYLTLAAVDEGVLSLTNFKTPDPLKYFFGQRQLGIQLHDHYGQLIQDPNAKPLALREGAGSARRGMPNTNIKITSLFSGMIKVDENGQAQIPVKLPDYNGRLRLMLVAWTKSSLGATSNHLLVRDPLIVSTSLARFLAVDDKSQLTILMINPAAPEGEYQATLSTSSDIKIAQKSQKITLKRQQQGQLHFNLSSGQKIGDQRLLLTIKGPENYFYQKTLKIGVRGTILPTIESQYKMLKGGEKLTLSSLLLKDFHSGTQQLTATITANPSLDVKGLLAQLDRYPHGCLEQTTSRAFPLLYANELSRRWQYKVDPKLHNRIQKAIIHLLQKQRYDGAFGLWSENDSVEYWLTSYTLDFLLNAKDLGYEIPPYFIQQGLQWLKKKTQQIKWVTNKELAALSYAHYILTKAGKAEVEETRYLFETKFKQIPTALAMAQLGVTLAMQGDHQRAKKALEKSIEMTRPNHFYDDYGSHIRDISAIIYLLDQVAMPYLDPAKLFKHLSIAVKNKRYLSTQEKAWMILAALSIKNNQTMDLEIDDKPFLNQAKAVVFTTDLKAKKVIFNKGKNPIWLNTTLQGSPKKLPENKDHYFKISRQWFDKNGQPIDMQNIHQGDLIFTLIKVKATSGLKHRAILMDLIPAGFEIENTNLANSTQLDQFNWLPKLSRVKYSETLDDRFIAAFDVNTNDYKQHQKKKTATYQFAYMMRAVTQGTYSRPAAEVEDMYLPEYRARTKLDKVLIKALK